MGYKVLVLILIISLLSISCSPVMDLTSYNESNTDFSILNQQGAEYSSKIYLLDEKIYAANYIRAEGDYLYYSHHDDALIIPLSSIEKVIVRRQGVGVVTGVVAGIIVMFVSGYIINEITGDGTGILGASSGLLLGLGALFLGVTYGGEYEYIFNDKLNYQQTEYYKERDSLKSKEKSLQNNLLEN